MQRVGNKYLANPNVNMNRTVSIRVLNRTRRWTSGRQQLEQYLITGRSVDILHSTQPSHYSSNKKWCPPSRWLHNLARFP